MQWLKARYDSLTHECVKRGFLVTYKWPEKGWEDVGWPASNPLIKKKDVALNRARIKERWPKQARYYGMPVGINAFY